jgi:hypothetical protein
MLLAGSLAPRRSWFQHVDMAPRDPILGVTERFLADESPNKINLGVVGGLLASPSSCQQPDTVARSAQVAGEHRQAVQRPYMTCSCYARTGQHLQQQCVGTCMGCRAYSLYIQPPVAAASRMCAPCRQQDDSAAGIAQAYCQSIRT